MSIFERKKSKSDGSTPDDERDTVDTSSGAKGPERAKNLSLNAGDVVRVTLDGRNLGERTILSVQDDRYILSGFDNTAGPFTDDNVERVEQK